jgi:ABC-type Zn uptake system ZnuABC Zn-binding protein ZnuA
MDYVLAIENLRVRLDQAKAALEGRPCVLFHDSMAYLAADLGLDVKLTLSVEGESGLSAADLKQVEALAADYPDLLLFYDVQYALRYDGVAGTPVTINTAVLGPNDWIDAMEYNIEMLRAILRGGETP